MKSVFHPIKCGKTNQLQNIFTTNASSELHFYKDTATRMPMPSFSPNDWSHASRITDVCLGPAQSAGASFNVVSCVVPENSSQSTSTTKVANWSSSASCLMT